MRPLLLEETLEGRGEALAIAGVREDGFAEGGEESVVEVGRLIGGAPAQRAALRMRKSWASRRAHERHVERAVGIQLDADVGELVARLADRDIRS